MKHALAHAMRRTARALIRQSNKLEPPNTDLSDRAMQYAGQLAGMTWSQRIAEGLAGGQPTA
ncbi:hypothetical protein BTO20_11405 [Mycobacterium dioxanotrophicus]|uniref:Uncharacterized protein n=1 Tax=Mycobacterium dioxanotrophicus TaxID=482462 RepID=A0A1Y0C1P8_9MYCO|nr:hypothetical protein BTO20_11405 [Mycobacterium dioxanotrophicus]